MTMILTAALFAQWWYIWRLRRQRDDFRRANEIRADIVERFRHGESLVLLDPGVRLVKEDVS